MRACSSPSARTTHGSCDLLWFCETRHWNPDGLCAQSIGCCGGHGHFIGVGSSCPRTRSVLPPVRIFFSFCLWCLMVFPGRLFHILGWVCSEALYSSGRSGDPSLPHGAHIFQEQNVWFTPTSARTSRCLRDGVTDSRSIKTGSTSSTLPPSGASERGDRVRHLSKAVLI